MLHDVELYTYLQNFAQGFIAFLGASKFRRFSLVFTPLPVTASSAITAQIVSVHRGR
jgi:hypothetical protein